MAEGSRKLSEEDLYECLKSLNVPVRPTDLKSPTREFIVRVFECFLKDLHIDIASPVLRTWESTKHIEDGDIYEEGQLLALLAMSMNTIANYFGSHLDITIKDVVEPKPKRTKKILNYLLVFWKYCLKKYGCFTAVEETFEKERKQAEDIMNENVSLDEKIADKINILQNMQPSTEELQKSCDIKDERISKLTKESETIKKDYAQLKTDEFNLNQQISAAQLNIIKAKEALQELSQLILSSPKQKLINTEIKALEEKIKDIDAKTKECESALKDETKQLKHLEDYQKNEEKVKNSLNEMSDFYKQLSEIVKAMVDGHQQLNEMEEKLNRLQKDLERKEDWILQQEQKFAKLTLNHKKQLETLRQLLKMHQSDETRVKEQLEFVKNAVEEEQSNIDTESNLVLDILKKCEEANAKSKKREAQHNSRLREIRDLFKSDCDELLEQLKNLFPYEPPEDS